MRPINVRAAAGGLRGLEIAAARPLGIDTAVVPLGSGDPAITPRQAIEEAILGGLQRGRCFVSFSGGRDSSTVLAIAVHLARREGLPLPIPITLYFPDIPESHESEWQRQVLSYLRIESHEIVRITDELDALGPFARESLETIGVTWPSNLYLHLPLIEAARGGALLTGFGGDELAACGVSRWAARIIANRWKLKRPHDVLTLGYALSPRTARLLANLARREPEEDVTPWLTTRARRELTFRNAEEQARHPLTWDRLIRDTFYRSRHVQMTFRGMRALGQRHDVRVAHPLVEPSVLTAWASASPLTGFFGRKALLSEVAADLLPDAVLSRRSKASFTPALWCGEAAEFTRTWDGTGHDPRYTDGEILLRSWHENAKSPSLTTILPLHDVWLKRERADK